MSPKCWVQSMVDAVSHFGWMAIWTVTRLETPVDVILPYSCAFSVFFGASLKFSRCRLIFSLGCLLWCILFKQKTRALLQQICLLSCDVRDHVGNCSDDIFCYIFGLGYNVQSLIAKCFPKGRWYLKTTGDRIYRDFRPLVRCRGVHELYYRGAMVVFHPVPKIMHCSYASMKKHFLRILKVVEYHLRKVNETNESKCTRAALCFASLWIRLGFYQFPPLIAKCRGLSFSCDVFQRRKTSVEIHSSGRVSIKRFVRLNFSTFAFHFGDSSSPIHLLLRPAHSLLLFRHLGCLRCFGCRRATEANDDCSTGPRQSAGSG